MSSIGRIFIVLNLVLSAAFVGWAAHAMSKATKYREDIAALNAAHKQVEEAKNAEIGDLNTKLGAVTDQQRTFREQRDGFEAEKERLKTQLDELKRANDTMQGNLSKIQATLGDYNNSIAQLTQQKDAAIERAHEAERVRDAAVQEKDAAMIAQRDAEEATKNANTRIGDLETEGKGLQDQVSTLETRLAMVMERTGLPASEILAQKKIDAMVLDVNRDLKLVVLNKGKRDEVKTGYVFDIYRGSQYKGQVRIQNVQDGMSSGLIMNEKNQIATGDSASTSL